MTDTGWSPGAGHHPSQGISSGSLPAPTSSRPSHSSRLPSRQNLAGRRESPSPARLVLLQEVAGLAHEQKAALYIVGGFVRDLLLERPSLTSTWSEGDAIQWHAPGQALRRASHQPHPLRHSEMDDRRRPARTIGGLGTRKPGRSQTRRPAGELDLISRSYRVLHPSDGAAYRRARQHQARSAPPRLHYQHLARAWMGTTTANCRLLGRSGRPVPGVGACCTCCPSSMT
jgi:hypothetical protein